MLKKMLIIGGAAVAAIGGALAILKNSKKMKMRRTVRLMGVEPHSLSAAIFGIFTRAIPNKASSLISSFFS